ncbi:MAG: hypothetical protein U9O54_03680 [Chloroflexota bacterium]|nr:hypothetical protein [Chloroflexota bacterium]
MLKKILIISLATIVVGAVGASAYNIVVDPVSTAEPEIAFIAPEAEKESEIVAAIPVSDRVLEAEIPVLEESGPNHVTGESVEQGFAAQSEVGTGNGYQGSNGNGKGGGGNGGGNGNGGGGQGKGNGGNN